MSELRLNFKAVEDSRLNILPDQIPNSIPKESEAIFMENDKDPYYKIVGIDYPIKGTGGIYEETFFNSYFSKLKDAPIPGSKNGHVGLFEGMGSGRPQTDFIVVGGRIEPKGNGEGLALFKVYIPKETENGSNETFIKENKAGMVHYSLVTIPEERFDNGIPHFTKSLNGERFDAVPLNGGAMKQKTNAGGRTISSKAKSHVDSLISEGKVNTAAPWSFTGADGNKLLGPNGDDWSNYALWHLVENTDAEPETKARYSFPYGKNGEVYLSGLEAVARRAGQAGLSELSEWASDKIESINKTLKNNSGEVLMETKKEALDVLSTLRANGKLLNSEIASDLELTLRSDVDESNAELVAKLNSICGDDPLAYVEKLNAKIKADNEAVVNARMSKEFGEEKMEDGSDNLVRVQANSLYSGMEGELEDVIGKIKEDPILIKLNSAYLDVNSSVNEVIVNNKKESKTSRVEVVEL